MTKAAKAGDKETSLDLTTKVKATSVEWMEKQMEVLMQTNSN